MTEENKRAPSFKSNVSGRILHLSVVMILSGLLLFANLHEGGLSGYDDALYAHEGQQMLSSGDWWNIRFNGGFHFEYPPMFFWLEALSMSIWGATDFAAKFPVALTGLLTVIAVYFMAILFKRNDYFPVCAAWILMLTQYFLKYSMHAMTDVPYAFFFTLAIMLYVIGLKRPGFFILAGVAIACAILTRSILGFIPLTVIVVHSLFTRRYSLFRSPQLLSGMLLSLVLPAIWYFSQLYTHGRPFLDGQFSVVFGKVLNGEHNGILDYLWNLTQYPRLLLKHYWPWLPFMLVGFWVLAKKALRDRDWSASLLVIWILGIIGPLSLAESKILRYIMPAFPAFALLAAVPISEWMTGVRRRRYLAVGYVVLCLSIVGIVVFTHPYPRAEEMRRIGSEVEVRTTVGERIIFYTGGEARHDYRNQFLWYTGRFCDYVLDTSELRKHLESEEKRFFVVDRLSYESIVAPFRAKVRILSDTSSWVFFQNL
jgi:4-amino-4-deoxy-L-arabinose transferase-like glycosyltransferase